MNKKNKAFRGSADPWSFRGHLQAQASQGVGTRAVVAWRSVLFSPIQTCRVMQEKELTEAMNRLTEELHQFRVLLTPELRKQEVIERIEKTDKELMASIRRKSRA